MNAATTPGGGREHDDGAADQVLAAALQAHDEERIVELLPGARLLVPVVARPVEGAEAEMAVPHLVNADGARALPVFTCLDSLRAWAPSARPVPMTGAQVLAAALDEGYDGVVVDVAGPAPFTLRAGRGDRASGPTPDC
jgi:hypothetical protein